MIKIVNTEVLGWKHAIRGMRNPKNSWDKSDSTALLSDSNPFLEKDFLIGDKDMKLMKALRNAGTDHRKYLRMLILYTDIVAPTFWWQEFDTYKVGTVRNSCSKMHKIHVKEFVRDDFSHEGIDEVGDIAIATLNTVIATCEWLRMKFNETQEKRYWRALIELLPEGYNMRATVMLNYEVLANQYKSRKDHKLNEWRIYCSWIKQLPYAELITGEE